MITVQYAKAFPGMRINAGDPGYTATGLNGNAGTQTVEEGAAEKSSSGPVVEQVVRSSFT